MQVNSSVHPPLHAAIVKLAFFPGEGVQLVGGALHKTPPLPQAANLTSMYIHVKAITCEPHLITGCYYGSETYDILLHVAYISMFIASL